MERVARNSVKKPMATLRAMAAATRDLALAVTTLARERSTPSGRPVAPFSDALLDRYPVLDERGAEALGVVPFRRAALNAIREDLGRRRAELENELAQLRGQGAAT